MIRAVLAAQCVIASATTVAALLLRIEGKIGTLAPGTFGELIVVNGNPLEDLSVLSGQDDRISTILNGGAVIKHG